MYHPGKMYNRPMWPQCWDLQEPRGLEHRDLRNLNLGDLKKGPNGGVSPTPQEKKHWFIVCTSDFKPRADFKVTNDGIIENQNT
jgi:hypothetical protein